ncbi:hypothetical protein L218DRAFT_984200 [Marasmius fiardii PR-910]|nr:hypothetical protein L218DRAFT_984200 [Marasmius fiardii PR-910]
MSSSPSSSSTRIISGSTPGLLDPSQTQRVLRSPNSRLSFAYHDPRTASTHHTLGVDHDLSKSRRVVIEAQGGALTWRFVPKALLDKGVADEGQWPRVIDICGQLIECSEDQWDIYKLDNKYECRVRLPPALSTITLATPIIPSTRTEVPHINGKRYNVAPMENGIPRLVPRKKFHRNDSPLTFHLSLSEDEIDESEVEEMIVDQPPARSKSAAPGSSDRTKKLREEISRNRQARREGMARRAEKLAQQEEFFPATSHEQPNEQQDGDSSPDTQPKRKATSLFNPFHDTHYVKVIEEERNMKYYEHTNTANSKRARTVSPMTAKRELDVKRHRRAKQKQRSRQARMRDRREQWNEQFMREIYAEVPELRETQQNGPDPHDSDSGGDEEEEDMERENESSGSEGGGQPRSWEEVDEAAAREAAIAESRRKLAELEKDRPLWEAEAHKRAMREKAEEEAARLRREQRRWAEERHAETERQMRAEEAKRRQAVDPRVQEERVRRQREKYARDRWSYGAWTNQRALERYKSLSESFDSTKFSEEEPLIWEAVPWPVLNAPRNLTVECISWDAVERFFTTAQRSMREHDFKAFVEKSHRRFHPDRWKARGILRTVVNDIDRDNLQVVYAVRVSSTNNVQQTHAVGSAGPSYSYSHDQDMESSIIPTIATPPRVGRSSVGELREIPIVPGISPTASQDRPPPRQFHPHRYGRGASPNRKILVSLIWNLLWGFAQIVTIIGILAYAASKESPVMAAVNEWNACTRPLGVWSCLWIGRVLVACVLSYWGWRRDRSTIRRGLRDDPEAVGSSSATSTEAIASGPTSLSNQSQGRSGRANHRQGSSSSSATADTPTLPHTILFRRLSLFSSLYSLSWFLTAHILVYTSVNTCRWSSPHLWWLVFSILCITYLMILEVVVLGLVIFIIGPFILLLWNIFLICIGRHPLQNPHMIKPEIGKLPKSAVDRIPLVMYIPPPPDAPPVEGPIKIPEAAYSYPPKPSQVSATRSKRRFKYIRNFTKSKKESGSEEKKEGGGSAKDGEIKENSWEDHWEKEGYPFVVLENNRAACAICLMDFEEPKRVNKINPQHADTQETLTEAEPNSSTKNEGAVDSQNITEEERERDPATIRLEDAGEGAQPLRLLACGHVFHKTCVDPWLTDVSGRCPVCQRPVEVDEPKKRKKGTR